MADLVLARVTKSVVLILAFKNWRFVTTSRTDKYYIISLLILLFSFILYLTYEYIYFFRRLLLSINCVALCHRICILYTATTTVWNFFMWLTYTPKYRTVLDIFHKIIHKTWGGGGESFCVGVCRKSHITESSLNYIISSKSVCYTVWAKQIRLTFSQSFLLFAHYVLFSPHFSPI